MRFPRTDVLGYSQASLRDFRGIFPRHLKPVPFMTPLARRDHKALAAPRSLAPAKSSTQIDGSDWMVIHVKVDRAVRRDK
jgi:hypothetical protein